MKRLIFIVSFFTLSKFAIAQKHIGQIEITPFVQWDNYPSFTFQLNSTRNNTVKMKGNSWGIGANYKFSLRNNFFAKFGTGYYKYSFDDIQADDPLFGTYPSRSINYFDATRLFYGCNKYWYNTVYATVGLERLFTIKKKLDIVAGCEGVNYFTFSQQYNIPGSYSYYDIKYKEANNRYFGFSFNLYTGLQKKFGKVKIGPTFILPVSKRWKQDIVFPQEENNKSRSKWLGGVGTGFTFTYSLN